MVPNPSKANMYISEQSRGKLTSLRDDACEMQTFSLPRKPPIPSSSETYLMPVHYLIDKVGFLLISVEKDPTVGRLKPKDKVQNENSLKSSRDRDSQQE